MTKRLAMMCFTVLLIVVNTSPVPSQTPSTTPHVQTKQHPAEPKVQMATWDATTGGLMGFSREEFDSMGLGKMTQDEYSAFLSWFGGRQQAVIKEAQARQQAVIKEAQASQLTYICGRLSLEAHDYEKVSVFLIVNDPTPAELASRIRQNLRGMNDVQIVYSAHEADLIVGILGYEINSLTNQRTGYAASIMTADPCISKLGGQQADFEQFRNMYLQTGGTDTSRLAESITRSLDATDIESARKNNAQIRQMLTNANKH